MTTAELESRLAGLLCERAEGAMEATNTPEKLSGLLEEQHDQLLRRRRRLIAGGALAAAAALAVTLWLIRDDDKAIQPAPMPDRSPAESAATEYLENFWSYDLNAVQAGVTGPVVLDEEGDLDGWRRYMAWLQAAGFSLAGQPTCEEGASSARAEGTVVHCDYELHALGSELVEAGPYAGRFDITVQDGKVTSAVDDFPFLDNGFSADSWEPFASYVARTHPDDVAVMYTSAGQTDAQKGARSRDLGERYIAEYVAYIKP
jgi:hypothetical protein